MKSFLNENYRLGVFNFYDNCINRVDIRIGSGNSYWSVNITYFTTRYTIIDIKVCSWWTFINTFYNTCLLFNHELSGQTVLTIHSCRTIAITTCRITRDATSTIIMLTTWWYHSIVSRFTHTLFVSQNKLRFTIDAIILGISYTPFT